MEAKERLVMALDLGQPDRLPVTTHHIMRYFLDTYLGGADNDAFFAHFGLDPIRWISPYRADATAGEWLVPVSDDPLSAASVCSPAWRLERDELPAPKGQKATRYRFITPGGVLCMVTEGNTQTTWLTERLIKGKRDVDLLGAYLPAPKCDVAAVQREAARYGARALIRGMFPSFDIFGQGGCWQDAACLVGVERLILETYDDPAWVHTLLGILQRRKETYLRSIAGASYDVLETGGGDASSTVISPRILERFVVRYDAPLIALARAMGQRVAYHTCGGMMPFLETIADMRPNAMETLTPPGMGGDVDLAEVKRRVGACVCLIGGWDQFHFFQGCSEAETRAEVRRCFEAAGAGGGFILSPSDHFFDADPALILAFADEARRCMY